MVVPNHAGRYTLSGSALQAGGESRGGLCYGYEPIRHDNGALMMKTRALVLLTGMVIAIAGAGDADATAASLSEIVFYVA